MLESDKANLEHELNDKLTKTETDLLNAKKLNEDLIKLKVCFCLKIKYQFEFQV